jgi:hypothetical protein
MLTEISSDVERITNAKRRDGKESDSTLSRRNSGQNAARLDTDSEKMAEFPEILQAVLACPVRNVASRSGAVSAQSA